MPPRFKLTVRKIQIYFSRRNRLAFALCFAYVAFLVGFAFKGDRGLLKSYRLLQESQNLDRQISKLITDNRELKSQVFLFRTNLRTVEKYARQNLRLAGENEIQYIFR